MLESGRAACHGVWMLHKEQVGIPVVVSICRHRESRKTLESVELMLVFLGPTLKAC